MRKSVICVFTVVLLCSALAFSACAPKAVSPESGEGSSDESAGVAIVWSVDSDCVTCHAEEGASLNIETCGVYIHAQDGSTCIACHNDEAVLAQSHDGVTTESKLPSRLKKSEVSNDTCLSCHVRDEIAAATADYEGLTDYQGRVGNPHDLPSTDGHNALECVDCHDMHVEGADIAQSAYDTCLSCHHSGEWECGTCHE